MCAFYHFNIATHIYPFVLKEWMDTQCTGFFIMNVTFKQVIKRAKRIVCTLILCSTCSKLFRVYTGGK